MRRAVTPPVARQAATQRVRAALRGIAETRHLDAATCVLDESALRRAALLDELPEPEKSRMPLFGVPIAVKELFDLAGYERSPGSLVPVAGIRTKAESSAPAVTRLEAAGAVVVARTRSHEYAWGMTTSHPVLGTTANPLDRRRTAGGSSGGSAALVAANAVPLALGTDTGGSIRVPAAFCGVIGMKFANDGSPLAGVIPLSPTLDALGVLARDATLAATAASVLGTAPPARIPMQDRRPMWRVGISADTSLPPLDYLSSVALRYTAARLRDRGCELVEVDFPAAADLASVHYSIQAYEALALHRDVWQTWPTAARLYSEPVRRRLQAAEDVSEADYKAAHRRRRQLQKKAAAVLADVDFLMMATCPCAASFIKNPDEVHIDKRPWPMREAVRPFAVGANLLGLPAVAIPVLTGRKNLPRSVQVIGQPGAEPVLLRVLTELTG